MNLEFVFILIALDYYRRANTAIIDFILLFFSNII